MTEEARLGLVLCPECHVWIGVLTEDASQPGVPLDWDVLEAEECLHPPIVECPTLRDAVEARFPGHMDRQSTKTSDAESR